MCYCSELLGWLLPCCWLQLHVHEFRGLQLSRGLAAHRRGYRTRTRLKWDYGDWANTSWDIFKYLAFAVWVQPFFHWLFITGSLMLPNPLYHDFCWNKWCSGFGIWNTVSDTVLLFKNVPENCVFICTWAAPDSEFDHSNRILCLKVGVLVYNVIKMSRLTIDHFLILWSLHSLFFAACRP